MERESFENVQVADVLNKHFIPIKIDREERPDIDRIYMQYVQASTGHGGWPMNVFITPDLEPVFGGTYWPGPNSTTVQHGSHPGFLGILERVRTLWETQRQRCIESAKNVSEQLKDFAQDGTLANSQGSAEKTDTPELELLEEAASHYQRKYDKTFGGFGGAPKFPTPSNLGFLLSLSEFPTEVQDIVGHEECGKVKNMVLHTLRCINRGGIHDQVGSGFARYSVTRDWSLPHFEKMLYDQGQLLNVYVDAFLLTGDAEMLGAVYDIVAYLISPPIAASTGGFYSSEDADSFYRMGDIEKREGAFYVWTARELKQILGEKDAGIVGKFFGVQESGNIAPENDAHDELLNQNVLSITTTSDSLAKETGRPKEDIMQTLKVGRKTLREHRERERPRPGLDDKIVVGWNGLAVGALARASSVLQSIPGSEQAQESLRAAIKAVNFIRNELFDPATGEIVRVYRNGRGETPAFADDYAYLVQGLIELYEATFDDQWLQFADTLQKVQNDFFWDAKSGGFFSTKASQADTLLRLKDGMDGAEPSTNGVSASNLWRLGSMLEDDGYVELAKRTCEAFNAEMTQHPFLFSSMMSSVVAGRLDGMRTVAICGDGPAVQEAIAKSRLRLKVNTTVVRKGWKAKGTWLSRRNSLVGAMKADKPSFQVCEKGVCKEELDIRQAEKALRA
ncbi:MAG: hypothetical protein Q9162_006609 [Coniocarpon cinnabarinum]